MIHWLRSLAPYHDYGWFIALLAWTAAALIARQTVRGQPAWRWLPWAAWAGAAAALLELASFGWGLPSVGSFSGPVVGDVSLGLVAAVAVAGWIWTQTGKMVLRIAATVAVVTAAGVRASEPAVGATAIAVIGLGAVLCQLRAGAASPYARAALVATAAALCLTSAGPLASLGLQPRRAVLFGEWSPVWSAAQAGAALIALLGVVAPWFADRGDRREWRPFFIGCVAWLFLGLALAAAMSASARTRFEEHILARAQMAASLMDKKALEELLGPDFKLELPLQVVRRPGDNSSLVRTRVPRVTENGYVVQHQLSLIGEANGYKGCFAWIETPRAGWRAQIPPEGYSGDPRKRYIRSDRVTLAPQTVDDLIDWADRRGRVLPLLMDWTGRAHDLVFAKAPLFSNDARILGWIVVEFPRNQWVSAQLEPRFQAYVIVVFGFVLASLVAIQRVRTREREAARSAAVASAQAEKLQTAFLAKVSHELRTPIQSVLGYGELLEKSTKEPVAHQRLTALREHGELMLRLVNDLLDLSAIQVGAFRLAEKPAPLVELIRQTVESLRARAEAKSLTLTVSIGSSTPPWVLIDMERVRQLVLNLLSNAIKFTDQGGVSVILHPGPGDGQVVLAVRDTGVGISPAEMGRLFHPFSRLDSAAGKEGTGLGLVLTAGLCRSMGGDVAVESSAEGTTFRVWFRAPPCPKPASVAVEAKALPPSPLTGRRVLVADDNPLLREFFLAVLHDAGARCTLVEDGEKALLAATREPFDAIVLDLAMPRVDGLEVARRLRRAHSRVRIVGVSAHGAARVREEALAAGMDAFLVKPVRVADFLSSVADDAAVKFDVEPDSPHGLIDRLASQFRSLAVIEHAVLAAAVATANLSDIHRRAHHLMNSAAVVRDQALFDACAKLGQAAEAGDVAAVKQAWKACEMALTTWVKPAENR